MLFLDIGTEISGDDVGLHLEPGDGSDIADGSVIDAESYGGMRRGTPICHCVISQPPFGQYGTASRLGEDDPEQAINYGRMYEV